jgi:hypothetical protein
LKIAVYQGLVSSTHHRHIVADKFDPFDKNAFFVIFSEGGSDIFDVLSCQNKSVASNGGMEAMSQKMFFVLSFMSFVLLMLTIETSPALAYRCPAKTCTEEFNLCVGIGCHRAGFVGSCYPFCHAELDRCMQTGEFIASLCQMHGLIRK